MGYSDFIKYRIKKTNEFDKWLKKLKDRQAFMAIAKRITRAINGNFGDSESVGGGISEMRIFVGKGYRVYYIIRGGEVILLLNGGHKGTQGKDITKAKALLSELE
ncbi:type II toxin-antitoxin system RelE/ParE family toxin [Pseudoalteromonas arctica]|uniref:type II toxin-antitoxin system RelE/ParE family toxin n=1 Tax=Pseudoalteromonas arctica TaxID=394751 RepID=UPI001B7D74FC|nr:type II toxin-antitoxin system RelE/ParE family toxin [Pseudoalteromonas arctica]